MFQRDDSSLKSLEDTIPTFNLSDHGNSPSQDVPESLPGGLRSLDRRKLKILQDGPLEFVTGVITIVNGLINR